MTSCSRRSKRIATADTRTPQDLSDDIQRFLDDKPVEAVPPSSWYLARKYARRYNVAIATVTIVLASLVLASAFSTWQAIRVTAANNVARARTNEALRLKDKAQAARKLAESQERRADAAKQEALALRDSAEQHSEQRRRLLYAANMQLVDQLWNTKEGTPPRDSRAISSLVSY